MQLRSFNIKILLRNRTDGILFLDVVSNVRERHQGLYHVLNFDWKPEFFLKNLIGMVAILKKPEFSSNSIIGAPVISQVPINACHYLDSYLAECVQ